jgi:hypothetical protein
LKKSILDEITEPEQLVRRIEALNEELWVRQFPTPMICITPDSSGLVVTGMLLYPAATIPQEEMQSNWPLL